MIEKTMARVLLAAASLQFAASVQADVYDFISVSGANESDVPGVYVGTDTISGIITIDHETPPDISFNLNVSTPAVEVGGSDNQGHFFGPTVDNLSFLESFAGGLEISGSNLVLSDSKSVSGMFFPSFGAETLTISGGELTFVLSIIGGPGPSPGGYDPVRFSASLPSLPGDLTQVGTFVSPEPSTLALMIAGAAGLLAFAWRRRTYAT